jgi:hypothetical protein
MTSFLSINSLAQYQQQYGIYYSIELSIVIIIND